MKKHAYCLLCLLLLSGAMFLMAQTASAEAIPSVRFLINGEESVDLWTGDGDTAYVFLPSYSDMALTVVDVDDGCTLLVDGSAIESGNDCSSFTIDQPYSLAVEGVSAKQLVFLHSDNVATLFITTDEGGMELVHANKDNEVDAGIKLYTSKGKLDYEGSGEDKIKGRGNSTWKLDKRPYNLKLGESTDLLGLGAAKKWSLLANAYDETNLRNKLVLDFAREVAPYEGFSPECAFVDVYVNGEYLGLYLMCQSVKDVTKEFLDTKSEDAYEIELTMANKVGEDKTSLPLNKAMSLEISYPSPCSDDQKEQLAAIISEFEAWLRTDAPLPEGVSPDIDSWARKILMEVVFENYDSPNASQYFWGSLKDGTIYAGPCWDYDLSMGIFYINWSTPYAFMTFKDWNLGEDISWYHGMWEKPEVRQMALSIYRDEFRDPLTELIDHRIAQEADDIAFAAVLDRARWSGYYKKHDSYSDAVADMTDFMNKRVQFLDSFWQEPDSYRMITMKLPNTRMLHQYVMAGQPCETLPLPCEVSLDGEGMDGVTTWYIEGTDEPFDASVVISQDMVLYAKYPEDAE